ncbi:heme-binding protein [Helicobacter sp. 11S02596-1]|uniref:GlcG/HbpS family heme-binding protein n=1 Tax=Helicobacter sp. 11S02596-1 TaxID=1476194 RepID=UPI000BA54897|nr:heme-binding protein [Helicobacter sp. 11S02596-1]PAF44780.1 hypothetical protein BJI48_01980 [Helicobacter sp. 11S02596-1]
MRYKYLLVVLCLSSFVSLQALPKEPVLTTDVALKIAQNALKQCRSDGYSVAVSILNASGLELVSLRDEKAGPHTLKGTYNKAYTSLSMKNSTGVLAQRVAENKLPAMAVHLDKRLVFMQGGLPIKVGNDVIGAIGVGGAPQGAFDEKCAQVGIQSAQKDLK